MLIKEACEACGLTKKAVEYYEQQGFIRPNVLNNGYRNYESKEISILKEISVLRKCGIGIQDIRLILESKDKTVALARYKRLNELKIQKLKAAQSYINELIQNYDIENSFHRMQQVDEEGLSVQEKLVLAFPGNYGLYLSLHFGRFLKDPIKSEEQRIAYDKIVSYLDGARTLIPDELNTYMEQAIQLEENSTMEKYEETMNLVMEEAIRDPEAYFKNFNVEEYISYRTSEEFKRSSPGKMIDLMIEFQKDSGYHDVFTANLRIVSPAYGEYCERLEAANAVFLNKYPQAGTIYGSQ